MRVGERGRREGGGGRREKNWEGEVKRKEKLNKNRPKVVVIKQLNLKVLCFVQ